MQAPKYKKIAKKNPTRPSLHIPTLSKRCFVALVAEVTRAGKDQMCIRDRHHAPTYPQLRRPPLSDGLLHVSGMRPKLWRR